MAMSERDDYLWDRSGEADEDVAALERALHPLRHDGRPARLAPSARRARWPVAAAAALLLGAGVAFVATRPGDVPERGPEAPSIAITNVTSGSPLAETAWVTPEHRVELAVGDLGRVTVEAGSRLQVRRAAEDVTRLYLERGRIEAFVTADARPEFFQVDTPSTRCVDLGCRYTLAVDADGNALVEVATGQVAFRNEGREVYVPQGAACRAARSTGAGTPRFLSATRTLADALDLFDAAARAPDAERRRLADAVVAAAESPRDTLPLWHLLQDRDDRVAVAAAAALERLAGKPEGLEGPAAARPGPRALALWKDRLLADWR
jgi:hypothetical protein